jgi:hypothetical protein
MVTCSCGKAMEKVPAWLESVTIEFVCNNCPQRQIKPISQIQLEAPQATKDGDDLGAMDDLPPEDDDE